jgi:hypothetical protein
MTDLMRVSVKQLEMAFNCPRKWCYHYLEGVPQLEGEALSVGNALHEQMKNLIRGEPCKHGPETFTGKMARELLQYAEPRSPKAVSEIIKLVELPEFGVKVDLRCDFLDLCPPGKPFALFKDWKTTGAERASSKLPNGKLWALAALDNDFQANIYSFLLMEKFWPSVRELDAEWCFVSKKFKTGQTPRTWTVPHHFHYAAVRSWFETYCVPTIKLIRDLRAAWAAKQLASARLVPHNPSSCEFKGLFCDAAGHCAMRISPVMKYDELHLPVLTKGR